jgi:hypothetical protein
MRTKTLVVAAALLAAGSASIMAQSNVYSLNVVGYVNSTFNPGFTLIANPLNTSSNTLNGLLLGLPAGSQILKWNGSGFVTRTKFGATFAPDDTLNPGEGAFVNVGATQTNTWVGEVLQGTLVTAIPAGFSIRASKVPASFALNDADAGLNAALASGSQVLKWNGTGYATSTKFGASFAPNATINVAESFFINSGSATNWTRNFTVQ